MRVAALRRMTRTTSTAGPDAGWGDFVLDWPEYPAGIRLQWDSPFELKPEKSVGDPARLDLKTPWKRRQTRGLPYEVDSGGGAFYGPKIDLKINDALGRESRSPPSVRL